MKKLTNQEKIEEQIRSILYSSLDIINQIDNEIFLSSLEKDEIVENIKEELKREGFKIVNKNCIVLTRKNPIKKSKMSMNRQLYNDIVDLPNGIESFLEWITSKNSPFIILHGQKKRFATINRNFSINEVLELYDKNYFGKNKISMKENREINKIK